MTPTGILDGGDLVLTRTFAAPIDDVWVSLTDAERLGRWYGTWTGDPADGFVHMVLTAEPGADALPAVRYDIERCEPPRLLSVSTLNEFGHWKLTARLEQTDGVTTLEFRQSEVDPGMVPDLGPGWEWYLDRLAAELGGGTPPDLDAFEVGYGGLSDAYRALLGATAGQPDGDGRDLPAADGHGPPDGTAAT